MRSLFPKSPQFQLQKRNFTTDLLEYQTKNVLKNFQVPIQRFEIIKSIEQVSKSLASLNQQCGGRNSSLECLINLIQSFKLRTYSLKNMNFTLWP